MTRAGLACLLVIAILPNMLVAQPPQPADAGQQGTWVRQLPVAAEAPWLTPGQKAMIRFVNAVPYDSGAAWTDAVAVADLNGDGIPDLVVSDSCLISGGHTCANPQGEVAALLGNGDGTFQPAVSLSTGAYFATSVAVGDLNGDGIPDLVAANYCQSIQQGGCDSYEPGRISILIGNGDGTFQLAATYGSGGLGAYSVALADLTGNGKLDIVATNTYDDNGKDGCAGVLLGNGDGTFQPAVCYDAGGTIAASVAIRDLKGNGTPDLVVTEFFQDGNNDGAVGILLGNGDGTFQPVVLYDSGGVGAYSVVLGSLRGNGILDVVVANRGPNDPPKSSPVDVLLGNGDGTFQGAVGYPAAGLVFSGFPFIGFGIQSLAIADMNGDGIPDVVAIEECRNWNNYHGCIGPGQISVMLGNGDGTLQPRIVYSSGGYQGSGLAVADVNGDGRPDIVVTNACANGAFCSGDGSVAVLLNETFYTTKTALISSPNPAHVNQTVTFTATISSTPPVPNGEVVTFYNGKTKLGTGATAGGVASLQTSFSAAKTYTIKASYPGDAFRKASAGSVKQVVNP